MFLQNFSQWGRKKVQSVSISDSEEGLRASFLQYIMGRLPEPERTRFEERLLEDQDFSDAAAACEQGLIDGYAMRRLDAEETRTVGLWIEASPNRVERVAMARALLQATPRKGAGRTGIGFALAAAACLLAAATLYLVNARTLRQGQVPAHSAANTAPPQSEASPNTAKVHIDTAKPDVILVAAERTRGEQKTAVYQVHRQSPIQLQVLLPGEKAGSGYQVRVATLANRSSPLLQQNGLEAQSVAGQLYLTITLPAGSLPPATYTASVTRQGETLVSGFTVKWVPE
jgi:anti-sigma-K factor RskA